MMVMRKVSKKRVRRRQMRMTMSTEVSLSSTKSTHGNLHPVSFERFALVDQESSWVKRAMAKNLLISAKTYLHLNMDLPNQNKNRFISTNIVPWFCISSISRFSFAMVC